MRQALFVGLGNPGGQYEDTRHNVGADTVRRWIRNVKEASFEDWHLVDRWLGSVASVQLTDAQNEPVVVTCLVPLTGMNDSGRAVAAARTALRLATRDIVIVHDDMDVSLGVVRFKYGGSAGGHRGVQSIHTVLGAQDMPRARLGIGRPLHGMDPSCFVLERFPETEKSVVDHMIQGACEKLTEMVRGVPHFISGIS